MGAGYSAFLPLATAPNTGGVGLTGTSGCTGLGEKVLFEGQLSMQGLAAGMYTLAVSPGTGTTIMPYASNRCGLGSPAAFAAVPNAVTGDEITFVVGNPCNALSIISAVSRGMHGTAGSYDIPAGQTECRACGLTRIVTTFNQNIMRVNNNASDISISSGTLGSVSVFGNELTVRLTGATNGALFTIGFPGIAAACNLNQRTSGSLCWRFLIGDVNGSSKVDSLDILAVRGVLNQTTNATNFRKDVNCSGRLDSLDLLAIRGALGRTVPACP
jgi:hypothetical protein